MPKKELNCGSYTSVSKCGVEEVNESFCLTKAENKRIDNYLRNYYRKIYKKSLWGKIEQGI